MVDITAFDPNALSMPAAELVANYKHPQLNQDFKQYMDNAKNETGLKVDKVDKVDKPEKITKKSLKLEKPIDDENLENEKVEESVSTSDSFEKTVDNEKTTDESISEEIPDKEELVVKNEEELTADTELIGVTKKVDDETLAMIQEALAEIMMVLEQNIGLSEEELLQALEDINLDANEILTSDIQSLVLSLQGEDPIGMVTNEKLMDQVSEVTKLINEMVDNLEDASGLGQEEMKSILDSLENVVEVNQESDSPVNMVEEAQVEDMELPTEKTEPNIVDKVVTELQEENEIPVVEVKELKDVKTEIKVDEKEADEAKTQDATLTINDNGETDEIENNTAKSDEHSDNENKKDKDHEYTGVENKPNFTQTLEQTNGEAKIVDFSYTSKNIDTESLMKQLTDFVRIQKQNDLTEMEMQLHPQSLGTIKINLATRGGSLTAQFTTQNESVKQALEAQVTQLRQNLEEQGVKVEAIEISVNSHELERNLDQNGENREEQKSKEEDEKLTKLRRKNINLRAWANGEEEPADIEDEDTNLTIEMMRLHGNSMDLLA